MNIQEAISVVVNGDNLSRLQTKEVMQQIMTGECTSAQIGGLLIGLRMKGETVEEITAAAEVMAKLAAHVSIDVEPLIDIVGTGGDGTHTFNVSTAASFVAAGAGAKVAKHGNRSVSSQSGSADVLEQAGANLNLNPQQVAKVIEQAGVGFMFAPMHHSAMKHAIGPRKELAARTIFNILGPLTNPAGVKRQVVGVFDRALLEPLAQVLGNLGSEHALVVCGEDGMDEFSICAPSIVAEYKAGEVRCYQIAPEDVGLARAEVSELVADGPARSLEMINAVLDGCSGPARDIVVLNAGAGLVVAGLAESISTGVELAQKSIDSGAARAARDAYIAATRSADSGQGVDHA